MVRIENHCCDCATPGYPCRGEHCNLTKVEVNYCDHCDEEMDEIYDVDGEELCEDCLKEMFRRN
jgi:hypothetical protein